ncbi:MAG TPA: PQQ-binding-like beta-propeller repeat protein, partial [Ktedonobacterales bacterium]|nr:PQQ-binding-like beta-propeller repeat protein [Ktedonobacterales bacterium]
SAYIWRMQQKPPDSLPGPAVRWRYLINSPVTTTAAEANGAVYLGTEDGTFRALDATGHALRWMYKTGATIAPATPLAANGAIYFCTNDGTVYKLNDDPAITDDAERLLWRFQQIGMRMLGPALSGNVLYVASKYRRIFALDSEDGTIRWLTPATFSPTSPPTIADNQIYIAAANSACALDTSGTEVWRNPEVGAVNTGMVVANKLVYIGAQAGTVFALNTADGARRWKFATDDQIYIMPVVDTQQGAVYIGDMSGYFYAIDAISGALRWRQKLDSPIFAPQVVNDSVYAVSTGGYLYALDPAVGAVRWQYVVGQGAVSPLGAGANTLYVDAADHYFYALAIP